MGFIVGGGEKEMQGLFPCLYVGVTMEFLFLRVWNNNQ